MLRYLCTNRQCPLCAHMVAFLSSDAQFGVGNGCLCGDQLWDGDEAPHDNRMKNHVLTDSELALCACVLYKLSILA